MMYTADGFSGSVMRFQGPCNWPLPGSCGKQRWMKDRGFEENEWNVDLNSCTNVSKNPWLVFSRSWNFGVDDDGVIICVLRLSLLHDEEVSSIVIRGSWNSCAVVRGQAFINSWRLCQVGRYLPCSAAQCVQLHSTCGRYDLPLEDRPIPHGWFGRLRSTPLKVIVDGAPGCWRRRCYRFLRCRYTGKFHRWSRFYGWGRYPHEELTYHAWGRWSNAFSTADVVS